MISPSDVSAQWTSLSLGWTRFCLTVLVFCLLLSVCSGSIRGFDKGLVWVATGFKCSLDVLFFLLPPLWLSGHYLRVEQQVLICVSVFCTPQCWGFCLLQCVLHSSRRADCLLSCLPAWTWCYCPQHLYFAWEHPISLFWFWPMWPEPVARSSSCEGNQGSAINFLYIEVGHNWGLTDQRT